MNKFNMNNYREVINGEDTYKTIAENLKNGLSCYIGWTDQHASHFDLVFTYGHVISVGTHQRGIKEDYLFVSIIDYTSFGFSTNFIKEEGYIAEKLFRGITNSTTEKITELINGVILEL